MTAADDDGLLATLTALEVELHHPGVRCSAARLEALLHPQFGEIGRSGRRYDRATVVAHLAGLQEHPQVTSDAFTLQRLGEDLALLGYRSAARQTSGQADGQPVLHTLRTSLWQRTAAGWQLRWHQGTPAAEPW